MRMMEAYRINQIKSVCDFIGIADSLFSNQSLKSHNVNFMKFLLG